MLRLDKVHKLKIYNVRTVTWSPDATHLIVHTLKDTMIYSFNRNKVIKVFRNKEYKNSLWTPNIILLYSSSLCDREMCSLNKDTFEIESLLYTSGKIIDCKGGCKGGGYLFTCVQKKGIKSGVYIEKRGLVYLPCSRKRPINRTYEIWKRFYNAKDVFEMKVSPVEDRIALCADKVYIISSYSGHILYSIRKPVLDCLWSPGSSRLIALYSDTPSDCINVRNYTFETPLINADAGFFFVNSNWVLVFRKREGYMALVERALNRVMFEHTFPFPILHARISRDYTRLLLTNEKYEIILYNLNICSRSSVDHHKYYRDCIRDKFGNRNHFTSSATESFIVQDNTLLEIMDAYRSSDWTKPVMFRIGDQQTLHIDEVQDLGGVKRYLITKAFEQISREKYIRYVNTGTGLRELCLNEIKFTERQGMIRYTKRFFCNIGKLFARTVFIEDCPVGGVPNLALKLAIMNRRFYDLKPALEYLDTFKDENIHKLIKGYRGLVKLTYDEVKTILGFDDAFIRTINAQTKEDLVLFCIQGGTLYETFSIGFQSIDLPPFDVHNHVVIDRYMLGASNITSELSKRIQWPNCLSKDEIQVKKWFLNWFHSRNTVEIEQLLQFWTGQKWISNDSALKVFFCERRDGYIPTSKTCFSEIILGMYDSREKFIEKIKIATEQGQKVFGLN